MDGARTSGTPLEAVAEGASERTVEAFKLLSNETRLSILLALWEAFEPFDEESRDPEGNHLSFSELRDRVGIRQGAQFNYHLDKLVDEFVRKTDDGYTLQPAGHKIIRNIIAIGESKETMLRPTEIDLACPLCGASTAITYQDQRLYRVCTGCDGYAELGESTPSGVLLRALATPAIQRNRDPEAIFNAIRTQIYHDYALRTAGICPECSGHVETEFHVCDAHEPTHDEPCPACGRQWNPAVRFVCTVCKQWNTTSVTEVCMRHPVVAGFCWEHGIELGFDAADTARWLANLCVGPPSNDRDAPDHAGRHTNPTTIEEIVSADPVRVRVTIRHDADELRMTLDEDLNVADVTRRRTPDSV